MYTRTNPFLASIKERYSLCKPGAKKKVYHFALDLKGSGISYQVGDTLGIYPQNDHAVVAHTLKAMQAEGSESVLDRTGVPFLLKDYLATKANLIEISRKLFHTVSQRQTHPEKMQRLALLQLEENKQALKAYLEERYVWDFLLENAEVTFAPQELVSLLMPLLPRLYSISSSSQVVGEEVHLTVALVEFHSNGHLRHGVCTYFLCEDAPLHSPVIPIYVQPHHGFTLPDPSLPIIMVGPGTGVAPFRAFMQERDMQCASGKNWLFFGEWHREGHFFYEEFWQKLFTKGKLRLDVAFSRDQEHKVYVQHRMHEKGKELFQWLEEGAYFYVCGDAKRMAKDVEVALLEIIQNQGGMSKDASEQYLKRLRQEKRYLRDVY